ncbi:aminoglycoside phosphotransferase family protein [Cellulomonas shaoxiangyii]|uniref:Aminoglycoside phosphotransferase family protein n=1 Tax=Cellulomonas shaoxiangyii TaxID=2566013 RepID=A0A4P7SPZ0_9CELL|nr:aminoglycoside phosphotransferase family protein [Cellulomonas shaoxiangyii]QCB94813.1 aminoglycoside phosphotransferase family protein [Cellulomonas shaoxiangyii]TGY86543.1 aminoglycoside phosphotransferase family protein [Cellulomonas shaoxiangyii]
MSDHPAAEITVDLVRRLVAEQHPAWAALPVTPVPRSGWDNRTFRLGDELLVRLPSAAGYAGAVAKEQRWLPVLAPHLPLPIPAPVALGAPGQGYPWPWSVYRWLPGRSADEAPPADLTRFAVDLAGFLTALRAAPGPGPEPGQHNWWRGGPVAHYADQTHHALDVLAGDVDVAATTEVWDAAVASTWHGPDGWLHGDVAPGNLLVDAGILSAVIDFGTSGWGDPACDLVIAWTVLDGPSRDAFRAGVDADAGTWARARGWALWKALITLDWERHDAVAVADARRVLRAVLADHGSHA